MKETEAIFSRVDAAPSLSAYAAAARDLKDLTADLPTTKVALLTNHTFDIGVCLTVESLRRGFSPLLYNGGYDQYRQDLLDPNSELAAFNPDAILISLDLRSSFPTIYPSAGGVSQQLPDAAEWSAAHQSLLSAYRERSATPIFLLNFVPPAADMDGLLGGRSVFDWVMELNASLRNMAASLPSVFVVDAARVACATNLAEWDDRRLWRLARVGINPKKFPALAALTARSLAALTRPPARCLALDLDNTIWGGIVGEAGVEGIDCADGHYPGNAFADFQRAVLALRARGILLAVASKNDRATVDQAFRERADMPLRAEHVAEWEVHWEAKPESLRRIAQRLNIGLDSIVFLDDNPAEIDLVKMTLPAVRAYAMPARPEDFVPFLQSLEDFDQLQLSSEDLRRHELYGLRKKQSEMAGAAIDLESFYRSLHTVLIPEPAGAANFDRVVQLIQKTNQFNLTTRRHTKPYLLDRLKADAELWAFRVRDVHGDHGIIAVALLEFSGAECAIDTLLMSCRVIGRTIETAILSFCEQRAAARAARRMIGEYLPTAKNSPCRDFYAAHGFSADGASRWTRQIEPSPLRRPEWISMEPAADYVCHPS
jgi:FkbH-like protein